VQLIDEQIIYGRERKFISSVYEYEHYRLLPGYQSIARYHEYRTLLFVQFVITSADGLSGIGLI